jgi:cell division septal protein FtsQ
VNIASDGSLQVMPQWHGHVIQGGQSDNFHNKAHKAQALYAYLLQQGQMDSLNRVDLRYSNQVIHTFNPSPSS